MYSCRKEVSWKNWNEWRDVYNLLYSNDERSIMQGISKVSAWQSKRPIPTAIEVTASIQRHLHFEKDAAGLSLSIIRFVNGVVEPFKKLNQSSSISSIGSKLNIPDYIVTIRHSATHGRLPTFEFVSLAALQALQWLQENYWEPQNKILIQINTDMKNDYISYLTNDSEKDPLEFYQHDLILSFGINVLVYDIMLNPNLTRDNIQLSFMERIGDLIQEYSKEIQHFPAAIGTKLAEEMCKGNNITTIWLEYLLKRKLAPAKSIAMIVKWADQNLLKKSLPDPVLNLLPDISKSPSCSNLAGSQFQGQARWPPTSIGSLPIDNPYSTLTLLENEVGYCDDSLQDNEETTNKDETSLPLQSTDGEINKEEVSTEGNTEEQKKEEKESSDDDIELW